MMLARRLSAVFAIAVILYAGYIVIGGLLGLPVFRSDISNDKKPELVGCYRHRGTTIFRVGMSGIAYGDNQRGTYQVISDKMGLAILPTHLLRVELSNSIAPKVIARPGAAELIPYDRERASLTFETTGGETASFVKAACNSADTIGNFPASGSTPQRLRAAG